MSRFKLKYKVTRNEPAPDLDTDRIIINNYQLNSKDRLDLRKTYGVDLQSGLYWYDSRSGLFGRTGESFLGVLNPGHDFGKLARNASNGDSGVFINNRELPQFEAMQLARLFCYHRTMPGRYWLDPSGDMGDEGYPFVTGNIYLAISIAQKYQTSSINNFWTKRLMSQYQNNVQTAS